MIIGNGLIGSLFKNDDREHVIFFASGVSNSLETDSKQFARERNLILETLRNHPDKIFVYFSTCSIYDSSKTESPYVYHKLEMEQIISHECKQYLILRVSNAVGAGGNPNLLMNYLVRSVRSGLPIKVFTKATRNLIDADDVKNITLQTLETGQFNRIINVAYIENYSIVEIIEIVERVLNQRPNIELVNSGSGYDIAVPVAERYFKDRNLIHKEAYLCNILRKYYLNANE